MENCSKYKRQYFLPPVKCMDWAEKDYVDHAPIWCSVDLRDGNQALVIPMNLEQKIEFFKMLVKIGFKEIEVGFPAASETEYTFLRTLIEENLIPDDVTIQVLTQAREHIIKKTFEAVKGAKNVIVHVYNSTSLAQREQVFKKSKDEIKKIAVDGAILLKQLTDEAGADYRFEYSPESFTGTEPEYALEVCNAVLDVWQPTADRKAIINLPVTVEHSMPHVYASQVEYMCKNLKYRENVVVSLHPHNDRGCGVADSEMGLLAGADRIEGTLFGNGERTGNVDIITLALNMYSQGVEPNLDFSNMTEISEKYEELTGMKINERSPYSGALVFAAFSGSHQDAIAKGMHWLEEKKPDHWTVPYLPIDPKDLGRNYDADVIRINSQSGKGGAAFIMQEFGFKMPKAMHPEFGAVVQAACDKKGKELKKQEVFDLFIEEYRNVCGPYQLLNHKFSEVKEENEALTKVHFTGTLKYNGDDPVQIEGTGSGPIGAFCQAMNKVGLSDYQFVDYSEHAISKGSDSKAISYIHIKSPEGKDVFGIGISHNINYASIKGVLCAINRCQKNCVRAPQPPIFVK